MYVENSSERLKIFKKSKFFVFQTSIYIFCKRAQKSIKKIQKKGSWGGFSTPFNIYTPEVNKTPAKYRDVFCDTLIAKKNGEGEDRTHHLLAGKHEKISGTSSGSNQRPNGSESNK